MSKLLSFIVPIYNTEKYLDECVRSIMNQGLRNEDFELIMVNDGSTDNSLEVANRLKDEFSDADITIIDQENQGSGAARNHGMEIAKGKYIEFVDSDDYLEENTIKDILETVIKTDVDVIEFRMKYIDKEGIFHESQEQPVSKNKVLSSKKILIKGIITGSVCEDLYKKSFLQKNNIVFPNSIYHEDVAFICCVYASLEKIIFTDYCPYIYRWNPLSKDRSTDQGKVRKSIIDNIYVFTTVRDYLENGNFDRKIKKIFQKRCNSMIVSTLIQFIINKNISTATKKDFIKTAKENGLYPIKGKTSSLFTTLAIPIINRSRMISRFF